MSHVIESRSIVPGEAASAVSWASVIAGAFVASAFSLALVAVGAGIGLISVSPWSSTTATVATFGILAGAWLVAVQLFSFGVGGYVAGRLRTRWIGSHGEEIYFRDSAHGLLVWALGAVLGAALLTSATTSLVAGAGHTAAQVVGGAASGAAQTAIQSSGGPTESSAYFVDMLFRSDHPAQPDQTGAQAAEVSRIFAVSLSAGDLSQADKTYLAQMVASRTGLSQSDAEKRVTETFDQAKTAKAQAAEKVKQAADAARKTGVYVALWAFISLLVGAFAASYMATVGGAQRDETTIIE